MKVSTTQRYPADGLGCGVDFALDAERLRQQLRGSGCQLNLSVSFKALARPHSNKNYTALRSPESRHVD